MKLNVPLLDSVMKKITEFPELHDQGSVFTETDCGTACCFAGWACVLSGYEPAMDATGSGREVKAPNGFQPAFGLAQYLLGLNLDQALTLFSPSNSRAVLDAMVQDLIHLNQLQDCGYYYDKFSSGVATGT